jgi:hypothetical protein
VVLAQRRDPGGEGRYVCMTWTVNGVIFRIDCYFDNESFTRQLDAPAEKAASSWQRTARQAP